MAKMDGEITVNVVFREAVCRGCKHLDDDDRCHRIWVVEELTRKGPYYFMLGFKQPESSEAVAEIDDPDDFGCNKWEAR